MPSAPARGAGRAGRRRSRDGRLVALWRGVLSHGLEGGGAGLGGGGLLLRQQLIRYRDRLPGLLPGTFLGLEPGVEPGDPLAVLPGLQLELVDPGPERRDVVRAQPGLLLLAELGELGLGGLGSLPEVLQLPLRSIGVGAVQLEIPLGRGELLLERA